MSVPSLDSEGRLLCAVCQNDYLHFRSVASGTDELTVLLWCENCGELPTYALRIYEHKGQIFVEWVTGTVEFSAISPLPPALSAVERARATPPAPAPRLPALSPLPRQSTTAEQRTRRVKHVMRVLGYTHNRNAGLWERIGGGTSDGMPDVGHLLAHLVERGGTSRIVYIVRDEDGTGYECIVDGEAFGTECNLREALCAAVSELAKRS